MAEDSSVLEFALKSMSLKFEEFIDACIDVGGRPKMPAMRDLMTARGYLPAYCVLALQKGKKDV